MFFKHRQKTGDSLIDSLISKRDGVQAQLYTLNEELAAIKNEVHKRQGLLREMNHRIILQQRSKQYLRLVSSQPHSP